MEGIIRRQDRRKCDSVMVFSFVTVKRAVRPKFFAGK
jgi:hypothetical protein